MNSKCPACGGLLVADVSAKFTTVPLHDDGYIPSEGALDYCEISNIRCSDCGYRASSEYYHEVECRLKTAVRVAAEKSRGENGACGREDGS